MKKTFFFDLDSTLLQMDQDEFLNTYFQEIARIVTIEGYPTHEFMKQFGKATYAMIANNGLKTNENLYWDMMEERFPDARRLIPIFEEFYLNDFNKLSRLVQKTDVSAKIINYLNSRGYDIILATKPLFPIVCTSQRLNWADLKYDDFKYVTTYENSTYCKPNRLYFEEILNKFNLKPTDCIMIGNDIDDDFNELPEGFDKIILTDYLINKDDKEINIKAMTLIEFYEYILNNF